MGPGGLFARVVQWLANEVIVKGLANNPSFQRFAVRSSQQAKELTKSAADAARSLSENQNIVQIRKESEELRQQANNFASSLREEIHEAMQRGTQQPPRPSKKV